MGEQALRDHFAGLAMQQLFNYEDCRLETWAHVAENAYKMADAMLKEREKKEDELS